MLQTLKKNKCIFFKKHENKMSNSAEMDKFLEKLNLPKLTQEEKKQVS